MKCKFLKVALLTVSALPLTGCIPLGKVDKYVGTYRVSTAYERYIHYAYGKNEVKSEREIIPLGSTIVIYDNKVVEFTYPNNGETVTGKIRCYSSYVKFKGLNFDNSFKFELKGAYLEHYYNNEKHWLEYDYTVRYIVLSKQSA